MAGYRPYPAHKTSLDWQGLPCIAEVIKKQYVMYFRATYPGPGGTAMPLKKVLTIITGLTTVACNTPAKPRLAPASTLKSRGFFYAWRKQA